MSALPTHHEPVHPPVASTISTTNTSSAAAAAPPGLPHARGLPRAPGGTHAIGAGGAVFRVSAYQAVGRGRAPILKYGDGGFIVDPKALRLNGKVRAGAATGVLGVAGSSGSLQAAALRERKRGKGGRGGKVDPVEAAAVAPGRGGDGDDEAEAAEVAVGRDKRANGRRVLTAWPREDDPQLSELTEPTRDPADRAHLVYIDGRTEAGTERMLATPRRAADRAVPRRYPPGQLTSQGVSHDSSFDELYERECRLGCVPGLGRRRVGGEGKGMGAGSSSSVSAIAVLTAARGLHNGRRLQDIVDRDYKASKSHLSDAEDVLARYRRGQWKPEGLS